jgi:signal recognition particle GTPase
MLWEGNKMVSSVRAGMIAQEKEKKRQRRILKQIKEDMESSFISVDMFNNKNQKIEKEITENVESKTEQNTKEDKPKKKTKAKKQTKNNNKVLKDSKTTKV